MTRAPRSAFDDTASHCLGQGCARIGRHDQGAGTIEWFNVDRLDRPTGLPVSTEPWPYASKSPYCPECWAKILEKRKGKKP
jgi:hypothetical protein